MPPGAEEVIKAASSRGWEAGMLVIVVLAMLAAFGLFMRWFMKSTDTRETRLGDRIDVLENFIHTSLLEVIKDNGELMTKTLQAIDALTATLNRRLCLMEGENQDRIVGQMADSLKRKIADK